MKSFRKSLLVRTAAYLLLAWTGVDLTNASLCALDREGAPTEAVALAIQDGPRGADDPGSRPAHVDDCFCCSHCVNPAESVTLVERLQRVDPICSDVVSRAHTTARALYHPPQLLS